MRRNEFVTETILAQMVGNQKFQDANLKQETQIPMKGYNFYNVTNCRPDQLMILNIVWRKFKRQQNPFLK